MDGNFIGQVVVIVYAVVNWTAFESYKIKGFIVCVDRRIYFLESET